MNQLLGKYLIGIGIVLLILGVILYFGGGVLGWFGRLPGDVRIEKENYKFYLPITSFILLSILLTLLINIFRRFF